MTRHSPAACLAEIAAGVQAFIDALPKLSPTSPTKDV